MNSTITLTDNQVNEVLDSNIDLKFQLFKDTLGAVVIDEKTPFSLRLKFYMRKMDLDAQGLIDKIKTKYSFMVKSKTSIQHYLRGVRTPKLSMVFAIAEALDVSPAQLLPAVPGQYIEYNTDHVEMLTNPIYADSSDVDAAKGGNFQHFRNLSEEEKEEALSTWASNVDPVLLEFQATLDEDEDEDEDVQSRMQEDEAEFVEEEGDATDPVQIDIPLEDLEVNQDEEDDDFDDISLIDDDAEAANAFLKDLFDTVEEIPYDNAPK
tara:strand:+ start:7150 stop:7944 length:795 start_codon:yes stop_codon:yes gene_type:complete